MSKSDHIRDILKILEETNFFNFSPITASIEKWEAVEELVNGRIMKYLGGPVDGTRKVYELLWDDRPISIAAAKDKKNYGNIYTRGEPATWPTI